MEIMKKIVKGLVSGILSIALLLTMVAVSGIGASGDPTISFITKHHCSSTSCAGFSTIDVYGSNFSTEARVKLNDGTGDIFGSYWGQDDRLIITDFTGLVACRQYTATVYFPSPDTRTASSNYIYNPDGNCSTQNSTSTLSPAAPAICDKESPNAVALSGSASSDRVFLNWNAVINSTHYMVRYGLTSGQYIYGAPDIGNVQTTTVQSLAPGTDYYFQVAGVNDCAGGAWSNELHLRTTGGGGSRSTLATGATGSSIGSTESQEAIVNLPGKEVGTNQEVKAEESICQSEQYAWWLPLVLQLGGSLLYAAYAVNKDKKFRYLLPIFAVGILSQLVHSFLGCNCATGIWCERYWVFNLGIVVVSSLISRIDTDIE